MAPKKHQFDQVVDDLQDWMTATRQHLLEGLYQGDRTPFAAPVSQKNLVAYYANRWFPQGPGGPRDEATIDQFIKSRGEPAYARTLLAIDRFFRTDLDATPPPRANQPPAAPEQEGY